LAPRSARILRSGVSGNDDIAGAVTWLSSPEASFITGQSILVDGGFNIGGMR
jgi:NAD(P)-dependent dehydrogenase (short-subunit alcohol dehydrogenase family)